MVVPSNCLKIPVGASFSVQKTCVSIYIWIQLLNRLCHLIRKPVFESSKEISFMKVGCQDEGSTCHICRLLQSGGPCCWGNVLGITSMRLLGTPDGWLGPAPGCVKALVEDAADAREALERELLVSAPSLTNCVHFSTHVTVSVHVMLPDWPVAACKHPRPHACTRCYHREPS